jgi:hypothetical protein
MNLYKVEFDDYGWDQYDGFVVAAPSEEEALQHIADEYPPDTYGPGTFGQVRWDSKVTVTLIDPTKYADTEIILSSFNAG